MKTIYFLSDFGLRDAYVGVVESVIANLAPTARVIHITHGIPPQDLAHASYQLFAAWPYLAPDSVVLTVVDPGVGSSRRGIVAVGQKQRYVLPDNGLLSALEMLDPLEAVYELREEQFQAAKVSRTFHGRDIFGPAAANLALGVPPERFGPQVSTETLNTLPWRVSEAQEGVIWTFDHYGNAITTLRAPDLRIAHLAVGMHQIPAGNTYADVGIGQAVALTGSTGQIEISVREGSARSELGLQQGQRVVFAPGEPNT